MPTIKEIVSAYRFFFYSHESNEPLHVHVEKDKANCKLWISPLSLASNNGFKKHELNEIIEIASQHKNIIIKTWKKHFGRNL